MNETKSAMATLQEYYRELRVREGRESMELIHDWPAPLVEAIAEDLERALMDSGLNGSKHQIRVGSSNQSIGNQFEAIAMPALAGRMRSFRLQVCTGRGYPDRLMVQVAGGLRIPLEVKATRDWSPSDSNRRVLTSSSEELSRLFKPPIHHLLMTVVYRIEAWTGTIQAIRLDFLEPMTVVNIRLEASVSHRILETGPHPKRLL